MVIWISGLVQYTDARIYRIVQGNIERVQAFVLCLEQALKAIKQQHPYAMTEEEGENHIKDWLFHRL